LRPDGRTTDTSVDLALSRPTGACGHEWRERTIDPTTSRLAGRPTTTTDATTHASHSCSLNAAGDAPTTAAAAAARPPDAASTSPLSDIGSGCRITGADGRNRSGPSFPPLMHGKDLNGEESTQSETESRNVIMCQNVGYL